MNIPLLDLKAQYSLIREDIDNAVRGILESQRFILGPEGAALETEIATLCGVPAGVAVASGTDALLLSLKALGVGRGDAVITVPYTFFATAGAIVNVGARPLFVDIEPVGFNMDPLRLSDLLAGECTYDVTTRQLLHRPTGSTVRAIIPVHLYGQCADMDEILEAAARYNLPVVEDACQAIGAIYRGHRVGSMGDAGCFSFFPSKNLGGAGDGGMVVSKSPELAARVRLLRGHGAEPKYYHQIVGFNSRLDELQAAILRVKLRHLEAWSTARRRNAYIYEEAFAAAELRGVVETPQILPGRDHIYHQYVIRCRRRDELQAYLKERGIGTEIYYPVALHEQECFRALGYQPRDCPNAHAAAGSTLALPIFPELKPAQIECVVSAIADFYRQ
jgi:dTDP-4-amino-4,6-dideoxygalactose transaminase